MPWSKPSSKSDLTMTVNQAQLQTLPYSIWDFSSHSASYHPRNIMENKPMDQSSRWSSGTNNQMQYIMLKLDKPAIVRILFSLWKKRIMHPSVDTENAPPPLFLRWTSLTCIPFVITLRLLQIPLHLENSIKVKKCTDCLGTFRFPYNRFVNTIFISKSTRMQPEGVQSLGWIYSFQDDRIGS